jgi:hypothetical protein
MLPSYYLLSNQKLTWAPILKRRVGTTNTKVLEIDAGFAHDVK